MVLRTRRRRFLTLASLGALSLAASLACGAPSDTTPSVRGKGTVLYPTPTAEPAPPTSVPTRAAATTPVLAPTLMAMPTAPGVPTLVPHPTAAPTRASIAQSAAQGDDEAHVFPTSAIPGNEVTLPARRLIIPAIGLDSKVMPIGIHLDKNGNPAWDTVPFAVGHHQGTAGPGADGNMVLSGHISSPNEGAIFNHLGNLKTGDGIIVASDERQYLYEVTSIQVVDPDDVDVLAPTDQPTATLITCWPDRVYSHRLVVRAELV